MKRLLFVFLLTVFATFSGCSAIEPETIKTDGAMTTEIETERTEETENTPSFVYEGAVCDYLLPLSDFSWERQYDPEFVMIHFTSAVTLSPEDPYNMDRIRSIFVENEVSVHYIVERDGTVRCYIPENLVAWHAGKGEWKENEKYRDQMNQYAIGIEVVAIGSQSEMSLYMTDQEYQNLNPQLIGYTDEQYEALTLLVKDICERGGIVPDREHIIGHEEYSPGKNDPGELFDWDRLLSGVIA